MRALARLATSAATFAPAAALAHGDVAQASATPPWTLGPSVTVPLALTLVLFVAGLVRVSRRSSVPGAWRASAALFLGGWVVLAGAIMSPLHAAGERSFTAHMIEHELLMLVAAPLLVLSRPLGFFLWALPSRWRVALAAAGRSSGIARPWQVLTSPVPASLVQMAALWGWHAPPAFDRALANEGWHIAQHLSFLLTALLFWWSMLRTPQRQRGLVVGCLFFTATASGALGALMAFSQSPWYAGYAALGLDAFGLSPAEDQQLAGVLMWVPGGLVHAAAGIALLARGLVDVPSRGIAACGLALVLGGFAPARAETVYVSDEQADVVHVLAADGRDSAIHVGRRPRGLALSADRRRLLVATSGDDRIAVVDLATRRIVAQLPSGPDPERFALAPDGRRLYVANEADAQVSAVDVAAGRVLGSTGVGAEPEGIAVSPDGRWVVATSETASLAQFIDAASMRLVDSLMVGTRPRDAIFSRDGRRLWVSSEARATVTEFDVATRHAVRVVDFDHDAGAPDAVQAVGMALSDDGTRLYVALGRGNAVGEVDASTGRIVRYLPAGQRVWGIALSLDGRRLYTANGLSGDVTVVDLARGDAVRTFKTGGKPWGVVVGP